MHEFFDQNVIDIGAAATERLTVKQLRVGVSTTCNWPLPNVWLGVSAENQRFADERIPLLLDTPAAVRWISAEPLLGPLEIMRYLERNHPGEFPVQNGRVLDWVVCGGESGHRARAMLPDWPRRLRDQCQTAGVPFFFKQWGAWVPTNEKLIDTARSKSKSFLALWDGTKMRRMGKKAAGRELDGREWNEFPR